MWLSDSILKSTLITENRATVQEGLAANFKWLFSHTRRLKQQLQMLSIQVRRGAYP